MTARQEVLQTLPENDRINNRCLQLLHFPREVDYKSIVNLRHYSGFFQYGGRSTERAKFSASLAEEESFDVKYGGSPGALDA
jgi:hypothetical protein